MGNFWNDDLAQMPGGHFLQTSQWAEIKRKFGWKPHFLCWVESGDEIIMLPWKPDLREIRGLALVLVRSVQFGKFESGFRFIYSPKGPLLDWGIPGLAEKVITDLVQFAKSQGAFVIKIDPDISPSLRVRKNQEGIDERVVDFLPLIGWRYSREQVQFRNTVRINLAKHADELLMNMKQKTRYNIRLASRKEIVIREGDETDFPLLFDMYAMTSVRDGFVIRDQDYYFTVWKTFIEEDMLNIFIAEFQTEPVAAVIIIKYAGKAWYVYGMSTEAHREKMPNYLLQWEAIKRAKDNYCYSYDMWGAPEKMDPSDPLWGVYRFKEGFGGEFSETIGAWDYIIRPTYNRVFNQVLPSFLNILRHRGLSKTVEMVQS